MNHWRDYVVKTITLVGGLEVRANPFHDADMLVFLLAEALTFGDVKNEVHIARINLFCQKTSIDPKVAMKINPLNLCNDGL